MRHSNMNFTSPTISSSDKNIEQLSKRSIYYEAHKKVISSTWATSMLRTRSCLWQSTDFVNRTILVKTFTFLIYLLKEKFCDTAKKNQANSLFTGKNVLFKKYETFLVNSKRLCNIILRLSYLRSPDQKPLSVSPSRSKILSIMN